MAKPKRLAPSQYRALERLKRSAALDGFYLAGESAGYPRASGGSGLGLLEGLARGERALAKGRVVSHAQAKKRLSRWLKKS